MWIGSMLATASSVVAQLVVSYETITKRWIIECALEAIAAVGYGASTSEIQTFISWYTWSHIRGGIVIELASMCRPKDYYVTRQLLIAVGLAIVLCLFLILSSNMLIQEPVTQNSFKLVYNVIKFAIKNKHPRCRSVFTYCQDELPSRL